MAYRLNTIFDNRAFQASLKKSDKPLQTFRTALTRGRQELKHWNDNDVTAVKLVSAHAWFIDQLLNEAWYLVLGSSLGQMAALAAAGGYGRSELHPSSDIDLIILLPENHGEELHRSVEQFLRFLWDMGLDIGHSTRTPDECHQAARDDITITTNIMESRLLCGNSALYEAMRELTSPARIWSSSDFFSAKLEEQHRRHGHFGDTANNLEPNIKDGPGGLRDLQMLLWVVQRHYGTRKLEDLVSLELVTDKEFKLLLRNRNFLWQVRNGLHYAAGRKEDRLLFDYQRLLAESLGFEDKPGSLAVEQFMKRYYRTVKQLSVLNEILLQYFQEIILYEGQLEKIPINSDFVSINGYLSANDAQLFQKDPRNIFRLFLLLQQHPELKGIRARTIRLIMDSVELIDAHVRNDSETQSLFMEIIRQPRGITHEFRRMNTYGVLAAYLPAFGRVAGQMQYDLFHVYTVDEHTLFVVRNLRRFTVPEFQSEFPLASSLIGKLVKPERLYLAGLFHDIAKGRGGDHSELGESEARRFCRKHGISKYDTEFVCWLVKHHLTMSWTAQRRDISDPDVILDFARQIGDQEHLDNLYLLTVADIRGTSPKVWNDWKGHLLAELYHATTRVFMEGADSVSDVSTNIKYRKQAVLDILQPDKPRKQLIDLYWSQLIDYYFLNFDIDSLAWHAETIISRSAAEFPLVATRYNPELGGSEFLVFTPTKSDLLMQLTGAFDRLNLSIVDARMHGTAHGFALDSFVVMDHNNKAIENPRELDYLAGEISKALLASAENRRANIRMPRKLKHFPIKTDINFKTEARGRATIMHVTAQDRPGLLHQVAQALHHCDIKLAASKITTFGERAEDIFFIVDRNNSPIESAEQLDCLKQEVTRRLSNENTAEPKEMTF
ncbi:MAG: [protein-PII] uridylyltransferase [Gammaproteobacteria bacterium]|nr:[protein-PII] uridylyltransferase [Gammaproteobacteria bacterium]